VGRREIISGCPRPDPKTQVTWSGEKKNALSPRERSGMRERQIVGERVREGGKVA